MQLIQIAACVVALAPAALAQPFDQPRLNYFQARQYGNATTSFTQSYTTSTVYSTITDTITSCPPSVTNCPAESASTVYVTRVTAVSTTVCPVLTKTGDVSSSSKATPTPTPSAPGATGKPSIKTSPVESTAVSELSSLSTIHSTSTRTLTHTQFSTYTMVPSQGGDSTTTETITHYSTHYNTHLVTMTGKPQVTEQVNPHTGTKTFSRYITVTPVPASEVSSKLVSAEGTCNGNKVTVTETEKETVYVTMAPSNSALEVKPTSSEDVTTTIHMTSTRTITSTRTETLTSSSAHETKTNTKTKNITSTETATPVHPTTYPTGKGKPSSSKTSPVKTSSSMSTPSETATKTGATETSTGFPTMHPSHPPYPNPSSSGYSLPGTGFTTSTRTQPYTPPVYTPTPYAHKA